MGVDFLPLPSDIFAATISAFLKASLKVFFANGFLAAGVAFVTFGISFFAVGFFTTFFSVGFFITLGAGFFTAFFGADFFTAFASGLSLYELFTCQKSRSLRLFPKGPKHSEDVIKLYC